MWICKTCKRRFKNTNQWHSCYNFDLEDHLFNKSPLILALFELIENEVTICGEHEINTVKSSILFKLDSTFLAVKLMSERVELEFQTPYEIKGRKVNLSKRI